jgi:hypothetical protein
MKKIDLEDTWDQSPDCDNCLRVYSNTSVVCKDCINSLK